jgi:hypothetical protein
MEEDIAYQLAAYAVGAAVVAAIRITPGCNPSDFVARVLNNVCGDCDFDVEEADLPPLTAPAIHSLNHSLNIAVGYLGVNEDETHLAHDEARQIIEEYIIHHLPKFTA